MTINSILPFLPPSFFPPPPHLSSLNSFIPPPPFPFFLSSSHSVTLRTSYHDILSYSFLLPSSSLSPSYPFNVYPFHYLILSLISSSPPFEMILYLFVTLFIYFYLRIWDFNILPYQFSDPSLLITI